MGIKNDFLENVASVVNNNDLITHIGFSTEPQQTGPNILDFTDEIGSRVSLAKSLAGRTITLSGVRSGADVIGVDGDTLNAVGFFPQSSGGIVRVVRNTPNIIHTENFDIESVLELTFRRRA